MAVPSWLRTLTIETGIPTLLNSPRDIHILLLARLIRMSAYGASTLILALFFSALGHSDARIGLFMSLTLVADVGISLFLSIVADALGRRRVLAVGATLMALSGVVFALSSNYWLLLLAAVVGVISPSGNEIGPFRAVEESTLAQLTEAGTRGDIFALYVVAGTLGTAGGSLGCGWVVQGLQGKGWSEVDSFRVVFVAYAVVGVVKLALSLLLTKRCEVPAKVEEPPSPEPPLREDGDVEGTEREPLLNGANRGGDGSAAEPAPTPPKKKSSWTGISKKSRAILAKLCGLFFFDSLASGMIPGSLIAYYMEQKFPSLPRGELGTIIAVSQFVSSLGNIFASSVARRIGLVKTMVFTHLPSAIFLALLPAPSSLVLTIFLLIARSSLSSMDQAPRSAFLSAVVLPEERTAVMGIVNTVKTMSQSAGPTITGLLASGNRFWIAFVVAGGLKGAYDVAMLTMFVNVSVEGEDHKSRNDNESDGALDHDADEPAVAGLDGDDGRGRK